jgi:flagellar export protein FliJ
MAKFQFRPATLLRIRETTRDQRRSELAEAQREDAELQSRLKQLEIELNGVQKDCRDAARPGTVEVSRLVEMRQYAEVLRKRQDKVNEQRRALTDEIERRCQALIDADREVRILEKLRDHQWQVHQRHEAQQEQKRLDETALRTTSLR